MALADEFDGLLVDLDGVVWIGREPVPGAAEALAELIEGGKEVVFVTNNSVKRPDAYVERLRGLGIPVGGRAGRDLGRGDGAARGRTVSARARRAFVIGAPGFKEVAAAAGLKLVDGEAGRSGRSGARLRPPRVRLRRSW